MYKTIKKILTTRDAVLVGFKTYRMVIGKTPNGDIYDTGFKDNKEEALKSQLTNYFSERQEYLNGNNWKIIKVFDLSKETFKEGDEVVVMEGKRKGLNGKIKEVTEYYYIVQFDGFWGTYKQSELSYPFKQEEKKKNYKIIRGLDINEGELVYKDETGIRPVAVDLNGKKYKLKEIK